MIKTNQEEFDINFNWKSSIQCGYMENNFNTHQNAPRQLYSVKKVTELWQKQNYDYDYYIYLKTLI